MRVSMGVFPTNRTKKSCSMTEDETVRSEGKRRRSFPNLLGWLGYWLLTYSSRAHWDFSWRPSTWTMSDRPQASAEESKKGPEVHPVVKRKRLTLDIALENLECRINLDFKKSCAFASYSFSLTPSLIKALAELVRWMTVQNHHFNISRSAGTHNTLMWTWTDNK